MVQYLQCNNILYSSEIITQYYVYKHTHTHTQTHTHTHTHTHAHTYTHTVIGQYYIIPYATHVFISSLVV